MTGLLVSPATTDGSAPSMPATTMTTSLASMAWRPPGRERVRARARDHGIVPVLEEHARDARDLLGALALAEDHLGGALHERAVGVDLGVAELLVGGPR